jgi:hypothetical protein
MTSIIPIGHILVYDAIEDEGRQLFPDVWTGDEGQERGRVLEIMTMAPEEQIRFEEATQISEHRQAARDRLQACYASLCKKLESGQLTAVVVDEITGIMTPADPAIFRSENVWQYLGVGAAPIDPRRPNQLGTLYIARDTAEPPKHRGGRPSPYRWDEFYCEIIRRVDADPDGLPETQAELVGTMLQWCQNYWGTEPGESTVKDKISAIYAHRRKGQKLPS